jgi:hypothetical protein
LYFGEPSNFQFYFVRGQSKWFIATEKKKRREGLGGGGGLNSGGNPYLTWP